MARLLYGGTGADLLVGDVDSDGDLELASSTYTAWTTRTGSTQVTDLQTFPSQSATSTITPQSDGRILFYGKDGDTAGYWLRDENSPSSTRWLVLPNEDMATRTGTAGVTDHGALTGLTPDDDHPQYLTNTRGDARYYTKTQEDAQQVRLTGAQTVAGVKTFSSAPAVPDGSFTIPKTSGLQAALDAKLAVTGSDSQLGNITDAVPSNGDMRRYDSASGQWVNIDPEAVFAILGPDGRLDTSVNPLWFVPIVVINEGDPVPSNFPANGIVFSRPAAATVVPVSAGVGSSAGTTSVVIATTQAFAVGDYIGFAIGTSGEITLPSTYTVSYATGVAAKSVATTSIQTGSAQNDIHYARVTTAIPAGTNITVTGNQSRVQFMVSLVKMINLASTAALDQTAATQGGTGSPLTLSIGPTAATTVPNQVALAAVTHNPGTGTITRTMAGAGGWQAVGPQINQLSTGGGSARSLAVFYRVLTTTGPVTATVQVTSSDGSNAAWAGSVATFKAA